MDVSFEKIEESPQRCPMCNARMAVEPPPPPHDAPCPACGYPLWCRKRMVGDAVVLQAIAGRTPEHAHVIRLCESLVACGGSPRVIVDLSELEIVNSAFVARLVSLNKRIRAAKGKLVLCGMHHILVWDAFFGSNLHTVFDISENEDAACANL